MATNNPGSNLVPIGLVLIVPGLFARKPLLSLLAPAAQAESSMALALLSDGMLLLASLGIIFLVLCFYRDKKMKITDQDSTQSEK